MKTWNETFSVFSSARACMARGEACAIVVLTRVKGSAFRRPGAKLLIRADGSMTGNVSGGCLENDLRERAMVCMQTGASAAVHYDTGSDEDVIWGLGLGCDGELDLLIVPVTGGSGWIDDALLAMEKRRAFPMLWPLRGDAPGVAANDTAAASDTENFIDRLEPPPPLIIAGAGDDAIPLARLAAEAGFAVTVTDHRRGYLTPERFPGIAACRLRPEDAADQLAVSADTFAVIKNHALEMDKRWAAFFDTTDARYIGILGPKKRCAQVREDMTSGRLDRVFGPAGLDIGAEGAEQIAHAIVAEMLAVWSGREPSHLRNRDKPIHDRT